ncbi:MAG: DUF2069 domain-containing protein [Gammaproteobacteria bacterium]
MKLRFGGRSLALAALTLLGLWLLLWLGILTHTSMRERIVWLALALPPLVVVGYFVVRDLKSGFVWCGFISLGYFAQGITVSLTSKTDAGFGTVEVFLSLLLFTAASAALRARRQPG